MSLLFFSFFAVSSFGAQPVPAAPGTDVECPAPTAPAEA